MRHTRVILLIFIIIAFLVNPVSALSKVAPYDPIPNQGDANLDGYKEFIATGHDSRIRQNGGISEIRLGIKDYSNIEEFYFTIWRRNTAGTYNKIHSTANISGDLKLVSGDIYEYKFTSTLNNIQEGDFYGYRIKTTDHALYAEYKLNPSDDNFDFGPKHQTYSKNLSGSYTNVPDGFDWENNTVDHSDYVFVIECYMENPYMIFIGNSIIAGFDNDAFKPDLHYSFIEPQPVTDPTGTMEYKWSHLDGDKTYQNMGINGNYITDIDSRFVTDAVDLNPKYILIEGGINDINADKSVKDILTKWDSMLKKVDTKNTQIIPVILLILPCNTDRQDRLERINDVNDELIKKAEKDYPDSIVVDARDDVGYEENGFWYIDADKTCDNFVHYNEFGNQIIAQAIYDAMHSVDNTPPTIIANNPTGTNVQVTTVITVTFDESMNTASVEDAFSINPSVEGTVGWSGDMMTFTPDADLAYSTMYEVTIGTGAEDLAGNPLAAAYIWDFTTGSESDTSSNSIPLSPGWNLISVPLDIDSWQLDGETDPLPVCVSYIVRYNSTTL
ncbi:MAG: Ig-like domain-containing protein, partial [ANME-2 cluster archaeon]|nr:Ig-like domain-containing protein [ANME-2 cluster archaeon]